MRLPWNHETATAGKQAESDGEAGCGFFVRGIQRVPSPSGGSADPAGLVTDHYVMRCGVETDRNDQTST